MTLQSQCVPPTKEKRLRYDSEAGLYVEHRRTSLFLKGPIPLAWLSVAAAIPGKALNVALAIRWVADMSKGGEVHVTKAALKYFGLSEDAYRDGLGRLEVAGLVAVTRKAGRRARVKILSVLTM
jgi:hypothetical protein